MERRVSWPWVVLLSAAGPYVVSELFSLFDLGAKWLLRRSVDVLPHEMRDRYWQEWTSELHAVPGAGLWRLLFALRIRLGARATARELGASSSRVPVKSQLGRCAFVLTCSTFLIFGSPLMIALTVLIAVLHGRPVFRSRVVRARDGRPLTLYAFNAPKSSWLGRFLDSTDLDALPSLVPMVKGRIWPTATQFRIIVADVWNGRPTLPFDDAP
jgi:hypothetical protein